MSQQGDQSDLISVAMVLCRDLCDMAHVLSRLTMMPTPNDNLLKKILQSELVSEETKEEMRESLDASIDDIDMPEKDKKEAKDSVSDLINRLANRRKSGEGSDDDA